MAASAIEECDRLLDIINTMLMISKTEAGVEKPVPRKDRSGGPCPGGLRTLRDDSRRQGLDPVLQRSGEMRHRGRRPHDPAPALESPGQCNQVHLRRGQGGGLAFASRRTGYNPHGQRHGCRHFRRGSAPHFRAFLHGATGAAPSPEPAWGSAWPGPLPVPTGGISR
ncbi:MAG: hypothetical protein MZV70_75415 [Desulfobacterales bacterium]|nr:hypothetical protein [Desulfobacterales bacterium]